MSEFEISFLLLCHFIVCSAGLASETAAFDRCSQWISLKKDTTIFSQRYLFSFLLSFATTFGEFKVKSLTKGTFGFLMYTSRWWVSSSVGLKNYFDILWKPCGDDNDDDLKSSLEDSWCCVSAPLNPFIHFPTNHSHQDSSDGLNKVRHRWKLKHLTTVW